MSGAVHWWCATCNIFDGPITAGDCDVCHDDGIGVAVEYLVPEQRLQGAIEERDALRSFVADFLAWRTSHDLNRLAGEAGAIADRWERSA